MHLEDHRNPGITDLTAEPREVVARVGGGPIALCRAAARLLRLYTGMPLPEGMSIAQP